MPRCLYIRDKIRVWQMDCQANPETCHERRNTGASLAPQKEFDSGLAAEEQAAQAAGRWTPAEHLQFIVGTSPPDS